MYLADIVLKLPALKEQCLLSCAITVSCQSVLASLVNHHISIVNNNIILPIKYNAMRLIGFQNYNSQHKLVLPVNICSVIILRHFDIKTLVYCWRELT